MSKKKIYFASDFHLGVDTAYSSKERELKLVSWLDSIKDDAEEIYLLGDVFDYWFEYKSVVPRGYIDFLGKLSELRRIGIPIYFFRGNHDMWMFTYFEKELGIPIIKKPLIKNLKGKRFYMDHGDGLATDKWINRFMKLLFSNRILQWAFARLHPNFALGLMQFLSQRSRMAHAANDLSYNAGKETMVEFANKLIEDKTDLDFVIMGHRHLPVNLILDNAKTHYINPGDWVHHFSYATFDGDELKIEFYENEHPIHPL